MPQARKGLAGREREGGERSGEAGRWMIKAVSGKAEGGKEVENDLTRSSLWSVLIFRALPLKRSTLYNLLRCLPTFLPPSPISTAIKGPSSYPRRDRAAHRCVRYRDDNVAREL